MDFLTEPRFEGIVPLERLRELREEAGLNQKQLAAAIGVRDNTISRWELGGNMPKDPYSMQFAAFFKVSVPYLMGASDDRNVILTEEEEEQIDEERFLTLYRLLSPKMQKMLIYTAHSAYLADRERQ